MAKRCFLFVFFQALMLLWFVFCVSGKVAQVLNMLIFPNFGGFCGVAYSCYLGFEGLSGFVFLVFVFILFRFCCFVALFWVCCWIVFGVVLVLFVCFFTFL